MANQQTTQPNKQSKHIKVDRLTNQTLNQLANLPKIIYTFNKDSTLPVKESITSILPWGIGKQLNEPQ